MSLATIIIPAYNSEDSLKLCLQGVVETTLAHRPRIIVANNNSEDRTAEIAAQYGAEIIHVKRQGPAAARNGGLAQADTKYVIFLDADCVPLKGWYQHLVAKLEGSDGLVGAGGELIWESSSRDRKEYYQSYYPANSECSTSTPPSYLLTSNCIFKRKELEYEGGFNTTLRWAEDLELGVRLSSKGYKFGVAEKAKVSLKIQEGGYLDQYAQFYKYGYWQAFFQDQFPNQLRFSIWEQWKATARNFIDLITFKKPQGVISLNIISTLGYLNGRIHGRAKMKFSPPKLALPVIYHAQQGANMNHITIDDGPSEKATNSILKTLKDHKVQASFFLLGSRVMQFPDLVQKIVSEGHEVFSHGFSHRRFDILDKAEILEELTKTENLLKRYRPTPSPYYIRLPYGIGSQDPFVHEVMHNWNPDSVIVGWSKAFDDWEIGENCQSAKMVLDNCRQLFEESGHANKLNNDIILLHDDPFGTYSPYAGLVASTLLTNILSDSLIANGQIKMLSQSFFSSQTHTL